MQIAILSYHYVSASNVSVIYTQVYMLVIIYLLLTGFGHFVFTKNTDFEVTCVTSNLTRLN